MLQEAQVECAEAVSFLSGTAHPAQVADDDITKILKQAHNIRNVDPLNMFVNM